MMPIIVSDIGSDRWGRTELARHEQINYGDKARQLRKDAECLMSNLAAEVRGMRSSEVVSCTLPNKDAILWASLLNSDPNLDWTSPKAQFQIMAGLGFAKYKTRTLVSAIDPGVSACDFMLQHVRSGLVYAVLAWTSYFDGESGGNVFAVMECEKYKEGYCLTGKAMQSRRVHTLWSKGRHADSTSALNLSGQPIWQSLYLESRV